MNRNLPTTPLGQHDIQEYLSIEAYSAFQHRGAKEALDALDRLEAQYEERYASQRVHPRQAFRAVVTICVLQPGQSVAERNADHLFRAWARSISRGGFSFLYPHRISETAIAVGPMMHETTFWRHAEIVRAREMPHYGFWEYGVSW